VPLAYLCASVLLSALLPGSAVRTAAAQDLRQPSPVGAWQTIDDATGKITAVLRIREENGTLSGTIEKLISPKTPNPRCTKCAGSMKDQPLLGLRILSGLRPSGSGWSGGQIVDPDSGSTYRCEVSLEDGGNKLKVRGYIGFSFLGRTQYWLREAESPHR
jgi:uncharacterized protein (DUF2147 family)